MIDRRKDIYPPRRAHLRTRELGWSVAYPVWEAENPYWGLGSNGTKSSAKAFSFLNTRSDFLTVAVVPELLATPSAALGDLASSASVAARPTRGDDVLEDHAGSILCPRAGHSAPSCGYPGRLQFVPARGPPAAGRKQQTPSRPLHRAEDSQRRFRHAPVTCTEVDAYLQLLKSGGNKTSSYQRGSRNPCPPDALAFCLRYSA
jgi:hypothetical protein